MARSHSPNPSFANHRHIMESQVEQFSYAFDDSFTTITPQGMSESILGNSLLIDETTYQNQATCIGEFRFLGAVDSNPKVRLSLKKWIELQQGNRGIRPSRTIEYRYQIWIERNEGDQTRLQVVRFDNGHSYGFTTSHHLHVQVDSRYKRFRDRPHPTHVGENFPYLSDLFEIGLALSSHKKGPAVPFSRLLKDFKSLMPTERYDPTIWVPKLNSELFEFITR
jgi:hypothetical protein